jgi:lipopolysaccharide transport system ATP-binding protein
VSLAVATGGQLGVAEVALTVENLSKIYRMAGPRTGTMLPRRRGRPDRNQDGRLWALSDVSFELGRGEVLGVIGPNGAGKSTLLKILGRVTPPSKGRAVVHGRVVPLLELGNAFQQEATGRDNVFLNAALYGIPRADVYRRFDEIVAFAELEEFIDEPVKRYSSGMYARLAFSVAVNMDPDVLLADEILAVGDMIFQERCLTRIREAGSLGTTVLFVSHDMAMVRSMCTRAIWLQDGRVAADGDPDSVIHAYETAAREQAGGAAEERAAAVPSAPDTPQDRAYARASEYGEILTVRALDPQGLEVERVAVDAGAEIEVTFALKRGGATIRCVLAFFTETGDAFRSAQPESVVYEKPGVYTLRAAIPPNLLNDTRYSVKVGLALEHLDVGTAIVRTEALSLEGYEPDGGVPTRGTYVHPLRGAVRPLLRWTRPHDGHGRTP